MEIWMWQGIITPHMMGLAAALTKRGCEVTYVAENEMREDRRALGWTVGDSGHVRTHVASSPDATRDLARSAPSDVAHICSGFRGNGAVGSAVRCLESRGAQPWIVMETVNDVGLKGALRRGEYWHQVARARAHIGGVLAIGYRTRGWLIERGMPAERVYLFTYFLDAPSLWVLGS